MNKIDSSKLDLLAVGVAIEAEKVAIKADNEASDLMRQRGWRKKWESYRDDVFARKQQIRKLKEAQKRLRHDAELWLDAEREVRRLDAALNHTSGASRLELIDRIRMIAPAYGEILMKKEMAQVEIDCPIVAVDETPTVRKPYRKARRDGLPGYKCEQRGPLPRNRVNEVLARLGLTDKPTAPTKTIGMVDVGQFWAELELARALASK